VVHSAGVDAQSGVPKYPDQPLVEQEVLDGDPVHSAPESPGSERFGRVVGPDHEAGRDPVCGGDSARLAMKADHLDSVADQLPPKPLAERLGGAPGKGRVGVCLDLELEADRVRHQLDQLLEQQRVLRRRLSFGVTNERGSDLLSRPLARPAIKRGAEREQRIVQQDQPIVGGQAYSGGSAEAISDLAESHHETPP
jgi:hypothetical protein